MTLASSAKYLSEKGLSVRRVSENRLFVHREGDRAIELVETERVYTVCSWEYVPGPGEDDFSVTVATLDEALLVTWCYFFATPIEISGWVLPIHRRPHWSLARLQYRLNNASHVTRPQFETVSEERRRRALEQPGAKGYGLAFAEQAQFILAGVHGASGDSFLVRRDLEEAYVVTNA
ncbi:MAG: hypothetical protein KIS62_09920 [Ramlibacter sp.]|nr:hypothetical protein [Ramlibacter sp.]